MGAKIEKLEKSMIKLIFTVEAEEFEAGCEKAYMAKKDQFEVTGFRRGKAPRRIIEQIYGENLFYEEGLNNIFTNAYTRAVNETGIAPVSYPEITDVSPIERGKDITITVEVAVKPPVKLGQYKGLEIKRADTEVTEEDVQKELEAVKALHSDVEDIPFDDAFAKAVSDYDTMEEYRDFLFKQIKEEKERTAEEQIRNDVLDKVIENAEVEIPDGMIDIECSKQIDGVKQSLAAQGMSFEDYLEFSGTDEEQMKEQVRPLAENNLRSRLIMEAVANEEGLSISEDEMEAELNEIAKAYNMEVSAVRDSFADSLEMISHDLLLKKAMDLVLAEAVII